MTTEVRQATLDDLGGIVTVQNQQNGAECEEPVRVMAADPDMGIGAFTVAVDGSRVVSSLCLIPERLRIEGTEFAASQVGYVATDPDYEGQGLVRRQMELVHEWSAARGELANVIGGISYFYRLFGYEYAVPMASVRLLLPGLQPAPVEGWTVRPAEERDVDDIVRLQDEAQSVSALVRSRSGAEWRKRVKPQREGGELVAEREGVVRGTAKIGGGPPGVGDGVSMLWHVAADRRAAVWALVAAAAEAGKPVAVERRPGTLGDTVLAPMCGEHPRVYAWYVRVGDPCALLDRLRPVLTARLARSPLAGTSGELLLGFYRSGVTITYERGEVLAVEAAGPEQSPTSKGGAGVPPDLVATLIFGRYGATGLAERHDDVDLGGAAGLIAALFPPLQADLIFD